MGKTILTKEEKKEVMKRMKSDSKTDSRANGLLCSFEEVMV